MQAISRAAVGAWGSEAARSNHCFLEVRLSFGHSNSIPTTPVVSRIFDGVIFMDESRLERRLAATLSADVGDHSRRYTDAGLIRQWARSIGLAASASLISSRHG
jgi:hypothetical protein